MRILVTGAGRGLGAALTEAWRSRGDEVLATDRVATAGVDLELDVTSDAAWAAARRHVEETWGGLDLLVNNAGVAGGGRLDVAAMTEWERLVEVNLLGVVRGTRTFVPLLKAQRSGHVLNIASLAGLVHPAGLAPYNAVKAAVVALTETTGHELAGFGVRASVACPSYFRTGLVDDLEGADTLVAGVIRHLVATAPLGPREVAAAVVEAVDRGEELILPDAAARAAHDLKLTDRAAHDAQLRRQAERLEEL